MIKANLLTARTEFASALNQICAERGISLDSVLETIKSAILAAYRKDFGLQEDLEYEVELNSENGQAKIFSYQDKKKKLKKEITPKGFGRIAAQTAKQVILQKIREAEKSAVIEEYKNKIGQLVSGMILRFDGRDIICDIGRGQARMPVLEQINSEEYHLNKRLTFYIVDIQETLRGKEIIISRACEEFVKKLFQREVPEVNSGAVKIKGVAREAGSRSKVSVVSTQSRVDPVGSCVGQKGVRVQAVMRELNNEKIDIIPYSNDVVKFITAALAPAEHLKVKIKEKEAVVTAPEDQLSLAIGKNGQNVRLAAKLTGYKINIKGSESKIEPVKKPVKKPLKTKSTASKKTVKKRKKQTSK